MVRSVLLVEADSSARSLQAGLLQVLGYRTRAVSARPAALAYARRRQPDAVLVGSSVEDGGPDRLCQELKLDPDTNPLALVRAGQASGVDLAIEPDAVLTLPASRSAVSAAMARALYAAAERRRELVRSEVRWRLPSDAAALERFQDQFNAWVRACGLNGFSTRQVGLAVRELAANAIEWGHRYQRERVVTVSAQVDQEKVTVLVRDTGPGFDPRNLPHAARHGDPITHLEVRASRRLREGGFGILMASGLVDHLAYNDVGNEALAVKYLPPLTRTRAERFALSARA